jgi:anti-sigma regulatory factor (Ser/Thr protein kinase)
VLKLSFAWGVPAVIALTFLLELLAPDVAAMFGAATAEELSVFSTAIRVFAAGLPLLLFNYVMITVYQSQGRMPASNAIVLLRELVGPLALMGVLTAPLGMVGIWAAFPLAELLTTVMVLLYSFACRRKNPQLSPVFLTDRQAEKDGESVSLTVRNDSESIVSAVTTIQTFCERQNLGSRLTMVIQLALEEMLVAIGENSLAGMTGHTMNVRVLVLGGEVIVRIRNGGARFNPLEYAQSLSEAPLELTGVMMILKMADVVDYRSTFGVNNLMMIVRG